MRQIEIEAYADVSQPDQGRVALLLRGLTTLARAPMMRLRPVDPTVLADGEGLWPEGDVLPTEARVLDDGVELIIGPDIAESPALLPGTAVEIEFPELRLRGEVLWPSISLAARPRRRNIVGKRVPNASRPTNTVARDRTFDHTADRGLGGSRITAAHSTAADLGKPSQPVPDFMRPDSIRPESEWPESGRPESGRPDFVRPGVARADSAAMAQANRLPQQTRAVQRPGPTAPARPDPVRGASARPRDESGEQDGPSADASATVAGKIAWQPESGSAAHAPSDPRLAIKAEGGQYGGSLMTDRPGFPGTTWSFRARLFGLIIGAVLAIETALFAVKGYLPTSAGADTTPGKISRTTATAGSGDLRLADVLQAAAISPRGVAVKENHPEKLLALANASLHAPGAARDVEEGAYWLKRYIAASLSEEHMLRALTQLGSAYAEPSTGTPDFVRARQLWEFASTFGDPVAMCFLGTLHEHGLGVAAEKKAALHWYARAKSAGGCPQLEESIARVMP